MVVVKSHRSRSVYFLCLLLFVSSGWIETTNSFRFGFSVAAVKEKTTSNDSVNKSNHEERNNSNKEQQYQQQSSSSSQNQQPNTSSAKRKQESTSLIDTDGESSSSSSWLDGLKMEEYSHSNQQQPQEEEHVFPPLPDHMLQNPLLQVPCSLQVEQSLTTSLSSLHPVATFVDTGAQVTILKLRAAQRARVLHLMDRRYAGHAIGVGQCRVLGRIPAGALRLHLHGYCVASPAITILDVEDDDNDNVSATHNNNHHNDHNGEKSSGVELLLGLDFLRDYQAVLNLREGEMRLLVKDHPEEAVIPFLLPRANTHIFAGGQPNHQSPMLQQCKSWILPLDDVEEDDEYSDVESSSNDSAEPIDMSGV